MTIQIRNQIAEVDNFVKLLHDAAKKDDSIIDPAEEKIIKKLQKASNKYIDALRKVITDTWNNYDDAYDYWEDIMD